MSQINPTLSANTGGASPGLISPFDISAFGTGAGQAGGAMVNRYQQLGLGSTGATPTSPGSFGTGSTAMQMDLGILPSLTGGIGGEFGAGEGQVQTQDLAQTLALAESNLRASAGNKGNVIGGINSLLG